MYKMKNRTNLYLPFVNNLFLIVLPVILLLLSFESLLFLFLFLLSIIFLYLKCNKKIFIAIVILSILISISIIVLNKIYDCNRDKNQEIEITGLIIDKAEYEGTYSNTYRYLMESRIKGTKKKYYVYASSEFDIGDSVIVKGVVNEVDGEKIEHGFDYENYLNKNKIYYSINAKKVTYESHEFTIHEIKRIVNDYFERHFTGNTLILLKGLVLGDSSGFSDELDDALKENGILHLFAVSGLHISLFISLIGGLLTLFKMNEEWIERIIIFFLVLYMIVTSFSVSIVRASLMYIFACINKRFFEKIFSSLDVLSFTFLILLLYNPYYAYNTGFILSFMVSFVIVLVSSLLKNKSNSTQILVISLLSNLITLPVIINMNYEYNLLTPVLNVLYINLVSLFILPFGFITLILPILSYAYDYVITIFIKLIDFTSNIHLNITLPFFNEWMILIFYGLIILIILFYEKKKYRLFFLSILFLFLISISCFSSYTINPQIDFLYLNDGDATLIRYYNQVLLIDAGDGNRDEVYQFLLSKGVREIDYLIITHAHDDHYGGVDKIIDKINVQNIVTSEYYVNEYKNQIRVKVNDRISLKGIEILIIGPSVKRIEENSNSLVLLMTVQSKNILFTGDATTIEENDYLPILYSHNINHIDVIKIPHHGSDTGSSEELFQALKVDYAVIMVGKMRKESHPSKTIINRLEKYDIETFITTKCYSIHCEINEGNLIFNTLKDN